MNPEYLATLTEQTLITESSTRQLLALYSQAGINSTELQHITRAIAILESVRKRLGRM